MIKAIDMEHLKITELLPIPNFFLPKQHFTRSFSNDLFIQANCIPFKAHETQEVKGRVIAINVHRLGQADKPPPFIRMLFDAVLIVILKSK